MMMDAEVPASGDLMKIETEEVGFQALEADTKLDNASWKFSVECGNNGITKNTDSDGTPVTDQINIKHETNDCFVDDLASRAAICLWISEEHNYTKARIKSEPEDELKVESCGNSEKYPVLEKMEEFIIKEERNDDDMFLDTNTRTVSHSALNQEIRIKQQSIVVKKSNPAPYFCYKCGYSTLFKHRLINHIKGYTNKEGRNVHSCMYKSRTCRHCGAKFTIQRSLDDHIIRKHPNFLGTVSRIIYKCSYCAYKTTRKSNYSRHILKHSETAGNCEFSRCIHCYASYRSRKGLNDHIIRKHPDFIASVSCKIHECKRCAFKTTVKSNFLSHILKHSEAVDDYKFNVCVHCEKKFRSKTGLNDHLIKKHPDFIASISSKIHECAHCAYKTAIKSHFSCHMWKHTDWV
ncbi:unnamed protein product [Acanthoscelides obtectus]|uniref:C2H2-type domain-containing protein n=1 Tax=Acanthoscelides obtectus TaxID=200917 RepID=A0A9P0PYD8_ACAOB|nr:unnamed protein product [Acanthoscelides obtectus]CAK1665086.1 RE1-silencing transcription factor [Acanthoscelides obtectus]